MVFRAILVAVGVAILRAIPVDGQSLTVLTLVTVSAIPASKVPALLLVGPIPVAGRVVRSPDADVVVPSTTFLRQTTLVGVHATGVAADVGVVVLAASGAAATTLPSRPRAD